MPRSWPVKDPNAILDYTLDWSRWLRGDTISNAVFSLPTAAGASIQSQDYDDTTATVWLSGGNAGSTAVVLCRITTAAGRVQDQSINLTIAEQ